MSKIAQSWSFDPRYEKGDTVWWVDEKLRFGKIIGLFFENTDKLIVIYQVEEVLDVVSEWHDLPQSRLFPDKEAVLTYLKRF